MALSNAIQTDTETGLTVSWHQQLMAHQASTESPSLDEFRQKAMEALAAAGRLPGRKDEHWKYFSLQQLELLHPELNLPASLNEAENLQPVLEDVDACRLSLRLGDRLDSSAISAGSLPSGVRLLNLHEAIAEAEILDEIKKMLAGEDLRGAGRVFQALNTAALGTTLDNTLVIHVAEGVDAGRLHIEWAPAADAAEDATAWMENCRLFIVQQAGSRLQLLECFSNAGGNASSNASLFNQVTQARLAENAVFDHLRLQLSAKNQHLFQFSQVYQARNSEYRYTGFELGGGMVRNELASQLAGPDARADLGAAFIGSGESCVDHHVLVDHVSLNCSSEQNFRGVLGDRSKGIFNGKAIIREGADGSSVRQSNANLLLSDLAEMNTKPELEIYADEVVASHGATVGQLDEQALFYLVSRGIGQEDARRMLTGAFCRAVGNRLSDRGLAEQIEKLLDKAMPAKSIVSGDSQ